MKKLISILLMSAIAVVLVACGNDATDEKKEPLTQSENQVIEDEKGNEDTNSDAAPDEDVKEPSAKPTEKPAESKPSEKPSSKPTEKPAENKPTPKPTEKPVEAKTMGTKLLADFKANASGKSTEEIANHLLSNKVILFSGGVVPEEGSVEKGFTSAISGFKSAARFEPMMGSIAFIGYIFELESESQVSSFISNLKSKADPRWNICVEADETVTGSAGNKVFFVMCPTEMN